MIGIRHLNQAQPAQYELWSWLAQRVTAALLTLFLAIHIIALHFWVVAQRITFDQVVQRFQSPFFVTLDILLLATGLFHGLNGVRMVAADWGLPPRVHRILALGLVALGAAAFVYGLNALLPFLTGAALF